MNLQFQRIVNLSEGIKWYVALEITSVSGICVRLLVTASKTEYVDLNNKPVTDTIVKVLTLLGIKVAASKMYHANVNVVFLFYFKFLLGNGFVIGLLTSLYL